jgi:hypothetical protein
VLRYEDRVMPHGRLLPIIRGKSGREPLLNKILGVFQDSRQPFTLKVFKLFAAQAEAASKGRLRERGKQFIQTTIHPESSGRSLEPLSFSLTC